MSFEELYRDTVDDLYAYVATLVRDRSAAEEVVAAAFERAYRKHASFEFLATCHCKCDSGSRIATHRRYDVEKMLGVITCAGTA